MSRKHDLQTSDQNEKISRSTELWSEVEERWHGKLTNEEQIAKQGCIKLPPPPGGNRIKL